MRARENDLPAKGSLIAFCREVGRDTGDIVVYPLRCEVTPTLMWELQIRSRANPELRYFVTTIKHWKKRKEDIFNAFEDRVITEEKIRQLHLITEL